MKFGVARDLITPDVKTHMGGYGTLYGQDFTGIHDDIYVKALVLDDDAQRVVLVTYDLLMHDYSLTKAIGEYIENKHGIDGSHLLVSYTHSHTGPALEGYDPGQASPEYEEFLFERTQSCIDRALVNTFEGRMEFGWVEGEWNISRRKVIDGVMRNAPNLGGNRDRRLNILKLADHEGECRALLLNYACHPVTLGPTPWISGEYPGRLCQILDHDFYGCTTMFFQGAGGNTRPLVAAKAGDQWKKCTFEDVDGMALAMAASVRKALHANRLRPVRLDLAARQFVVELETEVYPKEFFEKVACNDEVPDSPAKNEARLVLEQYDTTDNILRLHACIIRLSDDLYLAMLCGEVCLEVKQEIEKVFAGKDLIFVGYGDGTAYIPDDSLIDEGGYEVDGSVIEFCLKGRLKKGVNEKMREAYRDNLGRLCSDRQKSPA